MSLWWKFKYFLSGKGIKKRRLQNVGNVPSAAFTHSKTRITSLKQIWYHFEAIALEMFLTASAIKMKAIKFSLQCSQHHFSHIIFTFRCKCQIDNSSCYRYCEYHYWDYHCENCHHCQTCHLHLKVNMIWLKWCWLHWVDRWRDCHFLVKPWRMSIMLRYNCSGELVEREW